MQPSHANCNTCIGFADLAALLLLTHPDVQSKVFHGKFELLLESQFMPTLLYMIRDVRDV
jgi:hypothetical protein